MGLPRANIIVTDIKGVVYKGRREEMDPDKERFAMETRARTLDEVIAGADVFLGLSAGGVLKPEMVKKMAERPLILALANPEPEILPELAKEARPDCVIATGRSDYPNQVNNVLCFPFIFRGALDVGATTITTEMELAAVRAIAELAQAETSEQVALAYGIESISFGPDYIIPRPFDPRLIARIAPAVAKAAMDSGVATRPIADLEAYRESLTQFVYHSGLIMKPLFTAAKAAPRRIVYAEGEDERVLRAAQIVVDEGLARPILIGRPQVIEQRLERLGLRVRPGKEFDLVNPEFDPRYRDYWTTYHQLTERKGVSPEYARIEMRRRHTLIGAMLMYKGEADGMLCGTFGTHAMHLHYVDQVIGRRAGVAPLRGDERADAAGAHRVHLRHLRHPRPRRRAHRRDDAARGRGDAPLRHAAQGGAAVGLELRLDRHAARRRKMRRALALHRRARARARDRGRDARRRRALGGDPPQGVPELAGCAARPTCWSCRRSTPPTSRSTC